MKNKHGVIYKIVCALHEPHVVYVGKTTQTLTGRLSHHAARQRKPTAINKLIRTVGKQYFSIAKIAESDDPVELAALEKRYIQEYKCLYNKRIGADFTEKDVQEARETCYKNRAVICDEMGTAYISSAEAARALGLCGSDVQECCAKHLQQTKGLHFRYADMPREGYVEYWNNSMIHRNRRVHCPELRQTYVNCQAAATATGVSRDIVYRQCNHKVANSRCGYTFMYEDSK